MEARNKLAKRLRDLADMLDNNKVETAFEEFTVGDIDFQRMNVELKGHPTKTWHVRIDELVTTIK